MSAIGRLALREEGENWNAYYALPDTMEGAIYLGSVCMGAVQQNPKVRELFIKLMQEIVGDILKEATGERPSWTKPRSAPEHERTKE